MLEEYKLMKLFSLLEKDDKEKLATLVRLLNEKGHNPATSGNYSLRAKQNPQVVFISQSGVDKGFFSGENFIEVDKYSGKKVGADEHSPKKVSDETDIHLAIYRQTSANCVLHSHMLPSLLFADLYPSQDTIELTGLELLKGLSGIKTHEETISIPCFDNSQDIKSLSLEVEKVLKGSNVHGLILRGHGIYTWGESLDDAKRHLEVFEYIFQYYLERKRMMI